MPNWQKSTGEPSVRTLLRTFSILRDEDFILAKMDDESYMVGWETDVREAAVGTLGAWFTTDDFVTAAQHYQEEADAHLRECARVRSQFISADEEMRFRDWLFSPDTDDI